MQISKTKSNRTAQYVMDNNGKQVAVIIPIREYEKILDQLDDINAIKAYQMIKARHNEFVSAQDMFENIEKKRKLS